MINFMYSIYHSRNEQFKINLFLLSSEQSDPWPRARDCGAKATGQGRVSSENPSAWSARGRLGKQRYTLFCTGKCRFGELLPSKMLVVGWRGRPLCLKSQREPYLNWEAAGLCLSKQLKKYSVRFWGSRSASESMTELLGGSPWWIPCPIYAHVGQYPVRSHARGLRALGILGKGPSPGER